MGQNLNQDGQQVRGVLPSGTQRAGPEPTGRADQPRPRRGPAVLRSRTTHLRQLVSRTEDTELALGSKVMTASLDGYALLKALSKGSGLETRRAEVGSRFAKRATKAVREVT